MDRRELLKGVSAASVVGSLFGPEALASAELPLGERLVHLEEHTELLGSRPPAPLLIRGLRAAGLSERTFSNILSGLLLARVFKECSEEEQQDARWRPVMERIVPRFTESLAALMERMEGRTETRVVRRMLRRPNKLARIVNTGLTGEVKTRRERELRQAMAGLSLEPNALGELYEGFDAAAQSVGTTRQAVAQPALRSVDEEDSPQDEQREQWELARKLQTGLLLLLGAPLALGLGLVMGFSGVGGSGVIVIALGLALCLLALIMLIAGIVILIQWWIAKRKGRQELEELSDADLLLLGDIEELLAA